MNTYNKMSQDKWIAQGIVRNAKSNIKVMWKYRKQFRSLIIENIKDIKQYRIVLKGN